MAALALLWLAAPTAPARDGAEFTAVAASLGVAHPTGFSLEILALRVIQCLPLGDLGFRANLGNALFGALALALVARLTLASTSSTRSPLAPSSGASWSFALFAPLALILSKTVLRGFTAVEVYASSTLFSLAALASLEGAESDPARASRALRALALFAGLSFVTHTTVRSAVLAAAIALVLTSPEVRRRLRSARSLGRGLISWVVIATLALSLCLYLVAAARRAPWADWGGPDDARGLVAHLSAARVRAAFSSQMGGANAFAALQEALSTVAADLGPVVLGLGVIGAFHALARARSALGLALVFAALFDLAYTVLINPMGTKDLQTLFVAEACVVVLAARGAAVACASPFTVNHQRFAAPGLSAIVAIVALFRADLRYAGAREGWASVEIFGGPGAIGDAPPRAVILCESDELCGGSLFARVCEGERPDVVVLPRQHLWDRTTWRRLRVALGHAPRERFAPRTADDALRVRRLRSILSVFGARVRWEQGERTDEQLAAISVLPSESPALARVTSRSASSPSEPAQRAPGAEVVIERAQDVSRWLAPRESQGVLARRLSATVLFSAGMRAANRGLAAAGPFFEASLSRDPSHVGALTNLAVVRAAEGNLADAIALTERALRIDPSRSVARANLARYRAERR